MAASQVGGVGPVGDGPWELQVGWEVGAAVTDGSYYDGRVVLCPLGIVEGGC